jgi:hypothetical protein
VFVTGKPFQPNLLFVGMAKSLPLSGALERCFTWVGSFRTHKHCTILERLARDEHSSLLQKLVTYGRKKVYKIGLRSRLIVIVLARTFRHSGGLHYKTVYGCNLGATTVSIRTLNTMTLRTKSLYMTQNAINKQNKWRSIADTQHKCTA